MTKIAILQAVPISPASPPTLSSTFKNIIKSVVAHASPFYGDANNRISESPRAFRWPFHHTVIDNSPALDAAASNAGLLSITV